MDYKAHLEDIISKLYLHLFTLKIAESKIQAHLLKALKNLDLSVSIDTNLISIISDSSSLDFGFGPKGSFTFTQMFESKKVLECLVDNSSFIWYTYEPSSIAIVDSLEQIFNAFDSTMKGTIMNEAFSFDDEEDDEAEARKIVDTVEPVKKWEELAKNLPESFKLIWKIKFPMPNIFYRSRFQMEYVRTSIEGNPESRTFSINRITFSTITISAVDSGWRIESYDKSNVLFIYESGNSYRIDFEIIDLDSIGELLQKFQGLLEYYIKPSVMDFLKTWNINPDTGAIVPKDFRIERYSKCVEGIENLLQSIKNLYFELTPEDFSLTNLINHTGTLLATTGRVRRIEVLERFLSIMLNPKEGEELYYFKIPVNKDLELDTSSIHFEISGPYDGYLEGTKENLLSLGSPQNNFIEDYIESLFATAESIDSIDDDFAYYDLSGVNNMYRSFVKEIKNGLRKALGSLRFSSKAYDSNKKTIDDILGFPYVASNKYSISLESSSLIEVISPSKRRFLVSLADNDRTPFNIDVFDDNAYNDYRDIKAFSYSPNLPSVRYDGPAKYFTNPSESFIGVMNAMEEWLKSRRLNEAFDFNDNDSEEDEIDVTLRRMSGFHKHFGEYLDKAMVLVPKMFRIVDIVWNHWNRNYYTSSALLKHHFSNFSQNQVYHYISLPNAFKMVKIQDGYSLRNDSESVVIDEDRVISYDEVLDNYDDEATKAFKLQMSCCINDLEKAMEYIDNNVEISEKVLIDHHLDKFAEKAVDNANVILTKLKTLSQFLGIEDLKYVSEKNILEKMINCLIRCQGSKNRLMISTNSNGYIVFMKMTEDEALTIGFNKDFKLQSIFFSGPDSKYFHINQVPTKSLGILQLSSVDDDILEDWTNKLFALSLDVESLDDEDDYQFAESLIRYIDRFSSVITIEKIRNTEKTESSLGEQIEKALGLPYKTNNGYEITYKFPGFLTISNEDESATIFLSEHNLISIKSGFLSPEIKEALYDMILNSSFYYSMNESFEFDDTEDSEESVKDSLKKMNEPIRMKYILKETLEETFEKAKSLFLKFKDYSEERGFSVRNFYKTHLNRKLEEISKGSRFMLKLSESTCILNLIDKNSKETICWMRSNGILNNDFYGLNSIELNLNGIVNFYPIALLLLETIDEKYLDILMDLHHDSLTKILDKIKDLNEAITLASNNL